MQYIFNNHLIIKYLYCRIIEPRYMLYAFCSTLTVLFKNNALQIFFKNIIHFWKWLFINPIYTRRTVNIYYMGGQGTKIPYPAKSLLDHSWRLMWRLMWNRVNWSKTTYTVSKMQRNKVILKLLLVKNWN